MAKTTAADPVPAIVETEATGDTRTHFADIRATLGVPVVNLIWRHLATMPGALAWAWKVLKPLYERGVIADQARALNACITLPSGMVTPGALDTDALSVAGLTSTDVEQVEMILRSYARSNAMNIIAVGALGAYLAGEADIDLERPAHALPADEAPIVGKMPTLLSPDEMPPKTRALIDALNAFGGRQTILPTMYRHLAHWPGYLTLIHDTLAPCDANGQLETLIRRTLAESHARSTPLATQLSASSAGKLNASVQDDVEAALRAFAEGPLCKMIAIVAILDAAMSSNRR
ncbi:MAG: hypothetical protein ACR2PI_27320 [Hyphomicrobiaceae bacterium]